MRNCPGRQGKAICQSIVQAANADSFLASNAALATTLPPPAFGSLTEAKLDPRYRVGGSGEDMFSGNVNYSLPLVSLPGRAGLDLNLTLSYNSLVWIKFADGMYFDYDYYPTLTPGFRIGFPEVDGPHVVNSFNTFIVTLPSGRRVEMRQVSTNKYEAIDSSYLYLSVNSTDPSQMTLYTTDGTQFKFEIPPDGYQSRCTQVKDSNGNFISIAYKNIGDPEYPLQVIDKVTDTLGREVVFNYDANLHLQTITQAWQGQTFIWAQFEYENRTVQPNFGSLYVDGPVGVEIPVITRVLTGDGARHTFVYNSWGLAEDFWLYGEANNQRAALDYAFPGTGAAQSDCPRPSQRNDFIANWAGATGNGWVSNYFAFDAANETYGQVTDPDGVTHKELFNTANGKRGLPSRMETWHNSQIQKFTDITWVSDVSSGRPLRPRVTDTKVCDDRNNNGVYDSGDKLSRTTIDYDVYASTVRLPSVVKQYNEGGQTVYRATATTYISSSNYTVNTRRIIGLPSLTQLYEGDLATLTAQTEFVYDSANESGTTFLQAHASSPRQHDTTNYGTGFLYRGNLTKTRRYSVTGGSASSPIETKTGYYITGSPAFSKDALNHQTGIFYDDSFSGGVAPNPPTYAYPTKATDADGFSSVVKYNYDFGAVTETVDPKSYAASPTNPPVKVIRTYDTKGRLDKSAVWKDGSEYSHTRYVYGNDHNYAETWTTVNSLNEETFVVHLLDGVSRQRITISEHPGSAGGLKLQYLVFDKMGRVSETSNPTEIDGNWAPAGDDATGYAYSQQFYDWKGRPTITRHPDHTTNAPRESEISYEGCGCAGSQVVTFYDEGQVDHQNPASRQRRKQQVHYDVFGRAFKTQAYDWSGAVYSTTINSYTVRDQITSVKQHEGASGTFQETLMTYDGHGRLQSRKLPIESAATTYNYFDDDTMQTMTDARGATATYAYNNRKLVTGITYGVPSGVAATPNVTFGYDAAGNRDWMDDGPGYVDYSYDTLSRLQSESRQFDGVSGTYQFSYTYNLAGQIKTITDNRFNTVLTYNYDKAGQLTNLTGTGYGGGQTDFTSPSIPIKYRAWDGIKEINFGDSLKSTYSYGTRLQPTSYRLLNAQSQVQDGSDYQYYPDNRIKFASNLVSSNPGLTVASAFDRAYKFDHAGRLEEALTGLEASGGSAPNPPSVNLSPYKQTNTYDAWGNLTSRTNRFWRINPNDSATYVNNRRQGGSYVYDNTGNLLDDGFIKSFFDAANRNVRSETWTPPVGGGQTGNPSMPSVEIDQNVDGLGLRAKRIETKRTEEFVNGGPQTTITTTVTTTYYVRSSLAGGDIALELDGQGNKVKGYIYAFGDRLAEHWTSFNGVVWRHTNPVTGTMLQGAQRSEFDPLGAEVGNYDPWVNDPTPTYQELKGSEPLYIEGGDPFNARSGCTLDGLPISCSQFLRRVDNGSVQAQGPNGSTPLTHLGGGFVIGSYYRDAGFADAVATDSSGRSERFPIRVLDQIGFSTWLGIGAGFGLTGGQQQGGNNQQNPQPQNDCRRFADMVERIARDTIGSRPDIPGGDVQVFMDRLATTFTEFSAARLGAVRWAGSIEPLNTTQERFGSTGFANQYFEPEGNQVRHAVGGLIAGYIGISLRRMNARENPDDPVHGVPDINLNGQTVPMGARIGTTISGTMFGPKPPGPFGVDAVKGLAKWIRDTLCTN